MSHICKVCGFEGLDYPQYNQGTPSYEICLSCGFEPGVTDEDQDYSTEEWRAKWIKDGMVWDEGNSEPPEGWDPIKQLKNLSSENNES